MIQLPNPGWDKRGSTWHLQRGIWRGEVLSEPGSTSAFRWQISKEGYVIHTGISTDRISAMQLVETRLGYRYNLEEDYEMDDGCRCGSCTRLTGNWAVSDRADTVNKIFSDRDTAEAWIKEHITHEPDCVWWETTLACSCCEQSIS
jgi:hypothetical protein